MNIKKLFRTLVNFLVPTPATVRRHRAPSARFRTLEALAASRGDTLTRDGRSYTLATSDLRVLEFDNLAQVKSYLGEKADRTLPNKVYDAACKALDESDRPDGGPYPSDADYIERPRNMFKTGALSPAVAQGDTYDIGQRSGYRINADGSLEPLSARDVGSAKPFVPVVATPITNDIVRE